MEITEVRISPSKGGKVRAFASIVIDDCFIINDLRVLEGREGQLYVSMPTRRSRNGQMRDIAHPLNSQTRERIETRVLEEFQASVENLVVAQPQENDGNDDRREGRSSSLSRLTNKLFSEDFWTSGSSKAEDDNE